MRAVTGSEFRNGAQPMRSVVRLFLSLMMEPYADLVMKIVAAHIYAAGWICNRVVYEVVSCSIMLIT